MVAHLFACRRGGRAVGGALAAALLVVAVAGVRGPTPVRAAGPVTVVMQQLDSCRHALPGGVFTLAASGATPPFTVTVNGTGGKPTTIGSGGTCPTPTGSCVTTTVGCYSFPGVPAPLAGTFTYTINMTAAPPGIPGNPLGYAACTSGSACVSETINVTVDFMGTITQAVSTNVPPTGVPHIFASHAATPADPVLFYTFGLGFGSCDGDNDVDDSLTGSPSSNCSFSPEGGEVTTAYPWASTLPQAGVASAISLTLSPATLTADGSSAGTAVASVGSPNVVITFTTNGDATLMPSTAITDSSGVAATKVIAGHTLGTQTITATKGLVTGTATLAQVASFALAAVAGGDSALWVNKAASGTFTGFTSLGGTMVAAPAAAALDASNIYYLVTGGDHDLWIRTDALGWQRLTKTHVYCIDAPAAVIANSTLEVGCQASDHSLWRASMHVTAGAIPSIPSSSWHGLGGVITAGPAVTNIAGATTYAVSAADGTVWLHDSAWHQWLSTVGGVSTLPCRFHPAFGNSTPGVAGGVTYIGCHGPDDSLMVSANTGTGYTHPVSAGGTLVDGVGVAALGVAGVFLAEGTDGQCWQTVVLSSGAVSAGFSTLGGGLRYGAGGTAA